MPHKQLQQHSNNGNVILPCITDNTFQEFLVLKNGPGITHLWHWQWANCRLMAWLWNSTWLTLNLCHGESEVQTLVEILLISTSRQHEYDHASSTPEVSHLTHSGCWVRQRGLQWWSLIIYILAAFSYPYYFSFTFITPSIDFWEFQLNMRITIWCVVFAEALSGTFMNGFIRK